MDGIAEALAYPATRGWYLAFCFAVMIVPMVVLSLWFHRNIGKTRGGRALMERQGTSRSWVRVSLLDAAYTLGEGVAMGRDVASGRYGAQAKALMRRVYWFTGVWLVANAAVFGLLIWADEVNR